MPKDTSKTLILHNLPLQTVVLDTIPVCFLLMLYISPKNLFYPIHSCIIIESIRIGKGLVGMLHVFLGDMPEAIYSTAVYFKNDYEDDWIVDPFVKEMVLDIDKSVVLASGVIDSPVLGKIPPTGLSGGVKTLILVKFEPNVIFNASTCGDNCANWLLKIAEKEDRTVNLRHIMEFGKEPFEIHILNNDQIVRNMREFVLMAVDYV